MKLELKSKAATLEALEGQLSFASVLPLYRFSVVDYVANESYHHEKISKKFDGPVIVRSSSEREDNVSLQMPDYLILSLMSLLVITLSYVRQLMMWRPV